MTKHYMWLRRGTFKMYRHLIAIRMSVPNNCTFIPLIRILYFLYSDNGIDLMLLDDYLFLDNNWVLVSSATFDTVRWTALSGYTVSYSSTNEIKAYKMCLKLKCIFFSFDDPIRRGNAFYFKTVFYFTLWMFTMMDKVRWPWSANLQINWHQSLLKVTTNMKIAKPIIKNK